MFSLKNISIRTKLIIIQVITAVIAVLICAFLFIYNDIRLLKRNLVNNLQTTARVLGANAVAPLEFMDDDAVVNLLSNLKEEPAILDALILDNKGRKVGSFTKDTTTVFEFSEPEEYEKHASNFGRADIVVSNKIIHNNKLLGTVLLRAELVEYNKLIGNYIKIVLLVLLVGGIASFLLSLFLQRTVSWPLLKLVSAMKKVAETNNYRIRVPFRRSDEIGVLSNEFNYMLSRIEKMGDSLKEANVELENRVAERTSELTSTNVNLEAEIRKRQQAEKILMENEQRLKLILDNLGEGVVVSDTKGNFLIFNYAAEEILGKGPIFTAPGQWSEIFDFVYEDGKTQFPSQELPLYKALNGISSDDVEIYIRNNEKPDDPKIISVKARPVKDEDDKTIAGVITFRDITEQKKADKALRESEERYALAIQGSNDGIWDWNVKTNVVYFSPRWKNMLGYKEDEFPDNFKAWEEHVHPDDIERAKQTIKDYFEGKTQVYELEHRLRHKDGTYRWILAKGMAVRDKYGNPYRMIGSHTDLTERKKLEEEIYKAQVFLDTIIENLPIMIFVRDANEFRVIRINKAVEDILGYKREEIINTTPYNTPFPKEEMDRIVQSDTQAMQERKMMELPEFPITTRYKGKRLMHMKLIPIYDKTGKPQYVLSISEDITEKKKAEEELAKRTEELARSNTDLEQFAYVASHDLQEPLRTVASYVQLLQKRYQDKLDQDANEFIAFAVDGVSRMQGLIQGLLQYSRVSTRGQEPVPTDLNLVVKMVQENLTEAIKQSGAEITVDELPTVKGDSTQLSQVFQNLLTNAIKFRKKDIKPEIHISAKKSENGNNENEWRIAVSDNGIGIPKADADRIFVIFQRLHTKEEYEGTGIGLAVVKKIVERHGGKIWIESEVGEGTTFYFTLKDKNTETPAIENTTKEQTLKAQETIK